jgi:hypothetical protein
MEACMNLNRILDLIDMNSIGRKVDVPIDIGEKNFFGLMKSIKVKNEMEFRAVASSFYNHLFKAFNKVEVDMPFVADEVYSLLDRNFRGGYIEACRETLLKENIIPILREITKAYKKLMTNRYFEFIFHQEILQLDFASREKLAEQLVAKLTPFLPDDFEFEPIPVLAHKLETLLSMYSEVVGNLKNSIGAV